MLNKSLRVLGTIFVVLGWVTVAMAQEVLLTVKSGDAEFAVTRDMLEKLPSVEYEAMLPGMDDTFHHIKGPLLGDIIALSGFTGSTITAVAIDKYETEIPLSDTKTYKVVTATEVDGKPLTVRNKGPLWIVYPSKDHPELQLDPIYEGRSIWQLKEIRIQ